MDWEIRENIIFESERMGWYDKAVSLLQEKTPCHTRRN